MVRAGSEPRSALTQLCYTTALSSKSLGYRLEQSFIRNGTAGVTISLVNSRAPSLYFTVGNKKSLTEQRTFSALLNPVHFCSPKTTLGRVQLWVGWWLMVTPCMRQWRETLRHHFRELTGYRDTRTATPQRQAANSC